MIDFKDGSYLKLKEIAPAEAVDLVSMMLVDGEEIFTAFKSVRDHVIFTNKRINSVNVQGMTGRKRDFTSLPYSKIQAFSVETAGTFDLDSELDGVMGSRRAIDCYQDLLHRSPPIRREVSSS